MAEKTSTGENPNFAHPARSRALKLVVILIAMLFIGRLAQLQLIEGSQYRDVSEAQAIKKVRIAPFRGNLYDRNGILFVHNAPSFSVTITPHEFQQEVMPFLASLLKLDTATIYETMDKYKTYSPFIPIKLVNDADFETVAKIEEFNDLLPGVEIMIESKRLYEFEGNMAHLLGYTREITAKQLEQKQYYNPGDIVGRTGIEYTYESLLRGQDGIQYVAVDKFGKKVASFDNGKQDIQSRSGFDLHLTIDVRLQELAEELLKDKRGTIIALDPRNGEIIVYATKPDYDPREFSGKVSPDFYKALVNDEGKPLLNRAISSMYPPGSTWKPLIAVAALEEGIIDESTTVYCAGGMSYGGRFFKCHGVHGNVAVKRAIQASCNTFFYQMGLSLGLEKVVHWGRVFGFGQETAIDLPNESPGNYPLIPELEKRYKGYIPKGILLNYGIGQGDVLATPIQMAIYTAAIANNGVRNRPHLVRAVDNNVINKIEPLHYDFEKLPISQKTLDIVQEGMYMVVNVPGGTAGRVKLDDVEICGKTGTSQNPHGKDHAWFIAYAPRENPTIAMAVLVENVGFGGTHAAPLAKQIIDAFFHPDSLKKEEPLPKIIKPFGNDSTENVITAID